jgi:phosphatidylinositol alpha-1,6-mannosyltransferase
MVGQPTERERLETLARDLGVSRYVHFVGRVHPQDLVAWYNVCDIVLMTSRTLVDGDCEGYGIAVVEAALCGKPAIVSANTGLAEAIVDGVTGTCVPENDASAVAKEIQLLLGDRERRISMGIAARMRAETQQTWKQRGTLYEQILRETVQGHLGHGVPLG